jgi:FkbM family methyltransferase
VTDRIESNAAEAHNGHGFLKSWYNWLSSLDLTTNKQSAWYHVFEPLLKRCVHTPGNPVSTEVQINLPFLRYPVWLRPNTSDIWVASQVFMQRGYLHSTLQNLSPKFILDAGANIGLTAIFFTNLFPGARIVCVEPEKTNCVLLRKNVAFYPQIEVVQAGLWGSECVLRITNPDADSWAFRTVKDESACEGVRGLSVDQICDQYGEAVIDILKMDIEGAEKEVFASGTTTWLNRVRMLMIETHDRLVPDCTRSVYSALVEFPFEKHQRGELDIVVFQR